MTAPASSALDQLVACLEACCSPDNPTRQRAEAALRSAGATPGFGNALVMVSLDAARPAHARQLAAVYLKQFLKECWAPQVRWHPSSLVTLLFLCVLLPPSPSLHLFRCLCIYLLLALAASSPPPALTPLSQCTDSRRRGPFIPPRLYRSFLFLDSAFRYSLSSLLWVRDATRFSHHFSRRPPPAMPPPPLASRPRRSSRRAPCY